MFTLRHVKYLKALGDRSPFTPVESIIAIEGIKAGYDHHDVAKILGNRAAALCRMRMWSLEKSLGHGARANHKLVKKDKAWSQ